MRARPAKRALTWGVLAQSVRGAAHCRMGRPNQDAIESSMGPGAGPPLIVAVSDGHGSPKSFRSERGARFAVTIALKEARRLVDNFPGTPSAIKRATERKFPLSLVRAWEASVLQDIANEPFTSDDQSRLVDQAGPSAWRAVADSPLIAYGATLLLGVVTTEFLLLVQVGDGDIVTVSGAGCAERPLGTDPRLFAGETTSLCLKDAAHSFCVQCLPLRDIRPALVLLSTDGYANSYREDAGFLKVGPDLLDMIREDGIEAVRRDLAGWLDEVSRYGSGDDTTLGALCISECLPMHKARPEGI